MAVYIPTFLGFLSETLARYDFGPEEAMFLQWFHRFASSGKMEYHINPEDEKIYYRVSYQKVLRDFPFLKISTRKVSYYFARLCGILLDTRDREALRTIDTTKEYPLRRMVWGNKEHGGNQVFFAINEKGFQEFLPEARDWQGKEEYQDENKEKEEPKSIPHNKIKKQRAKPTKDLMQTTRTLIEQVLSEENSPFKHKLNAPGEPSSWLLLKAEEYLVALVGGTFLSRCPLEQSWVAHIDLGLLEDLKNSWKTLEEYLRHALKVYQEWLRESKNPELLTRDLSRWLYNPVTKKSLFLSCLSRAHTQRGFAAEKIQSSSFDEATQKLLEDFRKPWWSASVYWIAMKSVYSYFFRHWQILKDRNAERWGIRRIDKLMENYLLFLKSCKDPDPNFMAFGKPLWKRFVEDYFDATGIDLVVGEESRGTKTA